MCGIAGYYRTRGGVESGEQAIAMIRSIRHRGPDDEGFVFINKETGRVLVCSGRESDRRVQSQLPLAEEVSGGFSHHIAFAHRRFSIVDLSPAGHQPMWDHEEEICISFNGEIYNYVELRTELEQTGYCFATQSDTEVILRAYRQWGTTAFSRLNGPWAIALYDRRRNGLLLCRDRIGKVPLYYAVKDGALYFSSEIKAIREACGRSFFPVRVQAIDDYVVHGWRDLDGTFWSGIEDFPPAHFAWVNPDLSLNLERYWQLPSRRLTPKEISIPVARQGLGDLLADAIRIRLRADVPVAFELSGGMDSSALVAITAARLEQTFSTYTVKFDEQYADEEPYARSLFERYADRITYNIIRPGKADFWAGADTFVHVEEEPFHAPNLYTLQMLRRRIRDDGIKVVISGSAGDEVLAGYSSEYFSPFLAFLLRTGQGRTFLHEVRTHSETGSVDSLVQLLKHLFPGDVADRLRERHVRSLASGAYVQPGGVVRRTRKAKDMAQRMRDNMTVWNMNYWLRSGNKASFGIPIEPRSPFLDYRVVDFAFSLPPDYLIRDGWHKWILRETTKEILPDSIVWRRRKMGFPFPWREWLQQSKKSVMANLAGLECPFLDRTRLAGRYDYLAVQNPLLLWRLICLSLWWRRSIEQRTLVQA